MGTVHTYKFILLMHNQQEKSNIKYLNISLWITKLEMD